MSSGWVGDPLNRLVFQSKKPTVDGVGRDKPALLIYDDASLESFPGRPQFKAEEEDTDSFLPIGSVIQTLDLLLGPKYCI